MKHTVLIATLLATALTGCQSTQFNTLKEHFKKDSTNQTANAPHHQDGKMHNKPHDHHHGKMDGKDPHQGSQDHPYKNGGYHHKGGGIEQKAGYAHQGGQDAHQGFDPNHAHIYMCKMGASVKATYNPHNDTAKVIVHAPVWKLTNQEMTMKLSPAASGNRYVNDKNPESIYEWHTKGEMGILSVTTKGKTHEINCEGSPMPDNHPTYQH